MINKITPGRVTFNIINYGFMILFAIICIAPIWHVLMASLSDPRLLMGSSGILWMPLGEMTTSGYEIIMKNPKILFGYGNTIFYVAFTAIFGTLLTTIAGYLTSRKGFKLAKPLIVYILFTMIFSGGLIPTYMVIRSLGMINTVWAILIPGLMNAFFIVMMKSAFDQLPQSYEESAKIDGAGHLTILFKIMTPLIKANIAVVIMFTIVMQWNSWYPASIYLPSSQELWPLQLFMREILIANNTAAIVTSSGNPGSVDFTTNLVKYCVTILGTTPILCAYPFAQKYFVSGITLGGVKG